MRFHLLLGLLVMLNTLPAHAIGKRDVTLDRLERGERVEISPGYGLTINLMPVGKVNRAWLTDKSWLTIANENGPCPNGGCGQSRFIYLQLIDKLNFNGMPSTVDGATLLNAITPTGEVLQFKLVRDRDGIPAYTSLYVQPTNSKPEPVAYSPQSVYIPEPVAYSPPIVPKPPIQIDEIPVEILLANGRDTESELESKSATKELQPLEVSVNKSSDEEPERSKKKKKLKQPKRQAESPKKKPQETKVAVITNPVVIQPPEDKQLKPGVIEVVDEATDVGTEQQESEPNLSVSKLELPTTESEAQSEPSTHEYANAIGRGLVIGRNNKQVGYQSRAYRQAQSAMRLLRRGFSLEQAIAWSGSKPSVIKQLIKWGL